MKPQLIRRAAAACGVAVAIAFNTSPVSAAPATDAAATPTPSKAPASAPAAPSNTTYALRSLRINSTGSTLDLGIVVGRLRSAEVAGAIGQELLGISPELAVSAISEPEWAGNPGEVKFTIDLDPRRYPKARPAAKEFADRLVAKVSELLAQERRDEDMPRVRQAREWFEAARHDYDSVLARMKEKGALLGGQSPEGVRASLGKLEDERQKLELELAGMEARQRAVEEWIDRTSKQMQEQAKADPVIAELEKAVAAQEQVVVRSHKLYESGNISQAEVSNAEAKLSDVKVQLLERKRGPGGASAVADPLASLTRELQSLSIDTVDRKARLAFVEKRMVPLREAAESVSDFELLEAERSALRKELEQARQELRLAERAAQASAGGDRVIVVKSQDGKHERPEGSAPPEQ
jgi:hypothetical protein